MGRRLVIMLSMVVLLALAIGVVGAVSASPDDENDNNKKKAHTALTVLTKTREAKVVDLRPRGPSHGDMRIVNAPLYNESGKERVGRLDLFCALTDPADESSERAHMAQCTYTFTLPDGEISVQGVNSFPKLSELPSRGVNAVSGGTEKYAGVGGEVRQEARGTKFIHTFRFIG